MARILGQAGSYVNEEAGKKQWQMLAVAFTAGCVISWISGILIGVAFFKKLWWVGLLVNVAAVVVILAFRWWAYRQMEYLEKERDALRRGEAGEISVGEKLKNFPAGFYIVNGLSTQAGDLDHVVIGPTGVFALDAKSWKGVVTGDGKGELLLNNQPTEKRYVKQFVGRVMGTKERVKALAPDVDPYIQAVFVFTSARVEAKWGTTGNLHCIRDDQLFDYIVESKKEKRLQSKEVKTIARAFAALARMDPRFERRPTQDNSALTKAPSSEGQVRTA